MAGERLGRLRSGAGALLGDLREGDRAALVSFSHRVRVLEGLSHDLAAVRGRLDVVAADGMTALNDALYTSLALADGAAGRCALVLFSDGLDNISWTTEADVLDIARASPAVVYVVASSLAKLRDEERKHVARDPRESFLRKLTDATGGKIVKADDDADLVEAFGRVSARAEVALRPPLRAAGRARRRLAPDRGEAERAQGRAEGAAGLSQGRFRALTDSSARSTSSWNRLSPVRSNSWRRGLALAERGQAQGAVEPRLRRQQPAVAARLERLERAQRLAGLPGARTRPAPPRTRMARARPRPAPGPRASRPGRGDAAACAREAGRSRPGAAASRSTSRRPSTASSGGSVCSSGGRRHSARPAAAADHERRRTRHAQESAIGLAEHERPAYR